METVTLKTGLYSKRWTALAILCIAQFMVIMDTSIIGVALPAIQSDLGYSDAGLQWIFNAYVIFFGGFLLLGGRMSDLFGPRRIFSWGFVILTLASLLAGVAWSEYSMNIGRAIQGLGSALIAPAALTLVMTMFTDPKELGKALGLWGASAAAGGSAGVFLGGVITEWLSWNWVFLINIPLGLIVLMTSPSYLVKGSTQRGKLDLAGAVTLTVSLVALVYAIVTGEQNGWLSVQTILFMAGAIVSFLIFAFRQKKIKHPLLPFSIFKVPNLTAGNITTILLAASWIPLWFFLNLYLQQVLQLTAFNSGLALLPMTLAIMILMVGLMGKLIARFGFKKNLVTGLIMLCGSLLIFANLNGEGTYLQTVLIPSLLAAAGMSLAYIPATIASMSGAKPEETGLASGLVNTSYQIGSALGLAIIVALSNSTIHSLTDAGAPINQASIAGFQIAFYAAALLAGAGALIAIFRIKIPKA